MIVNGFIAEVHDPKEKMAGYDLRKESIGRTNRLSLMTSQLSLSRWCVEVKL